MKVHGICVECMTRQPEATRARGGDWIDLGDLSEEGVYAGECPFGHELTAVLQALRHELIFDSACHALMDGYYGEAIAGFGTSLERFYEFCSRVFCRRAGVEVEDVDIAWKKVAKQSERQLGAFSFLYLGHFKRSYTRHDETFTKLRNDVVHQGKFASRADSMNFGRHVYKVIKELLAELRDSIPMALEAEATHGVFARAKGKLKGRKNVITIGPGACMVSTVYVGQYPPFEEALEAMASLSRIKSVGRMRIADFAAGAGVPVHDYVKVITSDEITQLIRDRIDKDQSQETESVSTTDLGGTER